MQSAAKYGEEQVASLIQLEEQLVSKGATAKNRRPGNRKRSLQKQRSSAQARQKSLKALQVIEASKKLAETYKLYAIYDSKKSQNYILNINFLIYLALNQMLDFRLDCL